MKIFLKYSITLVFVLFIVLYVFDIVYTYVYENGTPRDKISWVSSMNKKDSLDFVLVGSSRCIHYLKPKLIQARTGKNGINLGYAASGPVEINLMCKTAIQYLNFKKLYIQIDYSFDQNVPDALAYVAWLPYLNRKYVKDKLVQYGQKFEVLSQVPLYRYLLYGHKIGFRNVVLNLLGKKDKAIQFSGFSPIFNRLLLDSEPFNHVFKEFNNKDLDEIIALCNSKNIELFFFTSPIYSSNTNFEILNNYLPNYKDFSSSLNDMSLFSDNTHVNDKGATEFTLQFIEYYFN